MSIGEATLQPYNRSQPHDHHHRDRGDRRGTRRRSRSSGRESWINGAFSPEVRRQRNRRRVPATLKIKGSFLVRVESSLDYKPVITWAASAKPTLGLTAAFDCISMKETYYLRPRRSTTIPCADCY